MQTFSTSKSSIAALLITLYPRLPTGPNDNRCHLQVIECRSDTLVRANMTRVCSSIFKGIGEACSEARRWTTALACLCGVQFLSGICSNLSGICLGMPWASLKSRTPESSEQISSNFTSGNI